MDRQEHGRFGLSAKTLLELSEPSTPMVKWGCSSAGRAPRSQRGGHRFDPGQLHQSFNNLRIVRDRLHGPNGLLLDRNWTTTWPRLSDLFCNVFRQFCDCLSLTFRNKLSVNLHS